MNAWGTARLLVMKAAKTGKPPLKKITAKSMPE